MGALNDCLDYPAELVDIPGMLERLLLADHCLSHRTPSSDKLHSQKEIGRPAARHAAAHQPIDALRCLPYATSTIQSPINEAKGDSQRPVSPPRIQRSAAGNSVPKTSTKRSMFVAHKHVPRRMFKDTRRYVLKATTPCVLTYACVRIRWLVRCAPRPLSFTCHCPSVVGFSSPDGVSKVHEHHSVRFFSCT
ncbi:hypothetical protein SAMN03159293_02099 [Pseudomonas sp. NFACC39-1]|nr:hypothetical protein SAMN03159293_02099 [Pseudomonas sp. NFACC39-1]